MRVHLLFFAVYRDLVGAESIDVDLPDAATAESAVLELRQRGGGFARLPAAPVIAINREYAPLASRLSDGDELALLPPVAGG